MWPPCLCSKVKSDVAEGALPEFDLAKKVGHRGRVGLHALTKGTQKGLANVSCNPFHSKALPFASAAPAATRISQAAAACACVIANCPPPPTAQVGRKIALQKDRRALVLCVVDVWDFDGSLPRTALQALFPPGVGESGGALPQDAPFQLAVAVNKFDLLPTQARACMWAVLCVVYVCMFVWWWGGGHRFSSQ